MGLILLLAPVVTFVSLAFLPPGRAGRIGIAAAGLVLGAVWLRAGAEPGISVLIGPFFAAVVAAALAQILRPALPAGQPAAYPGLVAIFALAGLVWAVV